MARDNDTGAGQVTNGLKRKSIQTIQAEGVASKLDRSLGVGALIALGVGMILGAGVFVLTGAAAAQFSGPAISLSFLLAAAACSLAALCYAELTSMMPASGSAYTYTYASLGEFAAWVIGWNLVLEYVFAASYVAVGWSGYAGGLLHSLGIDLPVSLANAPLRVEEHGLALTGGIINLPAVVITLVIMTIASRGVKLSASVNTVIVLMKTIALLLFIVFGALYVNPENWKPFIPENTGTFGEYGWSGVLRGAAVVFVAYLGFDALSTAAQESRNPQRDMPIAIIGSLAVCGVLYCVASFVLTGLAPWNELNVPNPLSMALRNAGGGLDWLAPVIEVTAVVGLGSVLIGLFIAQPRVLMAMGIDGLLPRKLGDLHPTYRTPFRGTLLTGAVVTVLAGLFPIEFLSQVVSLGALSVFIAVCVGVMILRRREPDMHRPFRMPAINIIAPAGALICTYLLLGLPLQSWIIFSIWTVIGLGIYFFFGRATAARVRAGG